tara:strand:- start:1802 stop:2116 length:315 start_codon:yes stop_codon:yes gene_type:complete
MENAFTMYNKNYYACKVCDGTVHVSLPCPDCDDTGKYEVVLPCGECEGTGTTEVDHLSNHRDHDCHYCDGTGEVTRDVDFYENIQEVAEDYEDAISITLKRERK